MEVSSRRRGAKALTTKGCAKVLTVNGFAIASLERCAIALFLGSILFNGSARSQLIPDNTLGAERSVVTPWDGLRERIDGGAIRGTNLFHSFLEFNVGEGRGVYFANPSGIENILTRVTGGNISHILGTLGVLGNANLFLMNPNGIYFGPNARLDISGSFLATTGDRIQLGNQGYFSATDLPGSQLLTVQPDALFANALRNYQAQIHNQGHLAVGAGQTLTLLGGTVINSGSLTALGGTVRVLGDRVSLLDSAKIDVSSSAGGGTVLVGGDYQGGGSIPTARQTFVGSGVTIHADAFVRGVGGDRGDGGRIMIWADETATIGGTLTARGGTLAGNGGFIETSGKQLLNLTASVDASASNGIGGTWLIDPTNITIVPFGGAFGTNTVGANLINAALNGGTNVTITTSIGGTEDGNITQNAGATILKLAGGEATLTLLADNDIRLNDSIISNNARLNVILSSDRDRNGSGAAILNGSLLTNGGDLTVNAIDIDTTAGEINSSSFGNAGDISLQAARDLRVGNIFSSGTNNGGNISLRSVNGTIDTTAGEINSSSFGNAGNISLQAAGDVRVGDIDAIALQGGTISLTSGGTLSIDDRDIRSATTGSGVGGDINLTARSLLVTNDADIINATLADGRSGNINVNVTEEAVFSNRAILRVVTQGTGTGGDINLAARSLVVTESSGLIGIAQDAGRTGNIKIDTAERILLTNDGGFGTTTEGSGNAGDVAVNTRQLMIQNQQGSAVGTGISTTSAPGSSGNSGNIVINASEFIEIIGNQPGQFTPKATTIPTALVTAQAIRGIPTGITTATTGSGNAGNLTIQTGQLTLRDGAGITSGTVSGSTGIGGRLDVNVAGSVELQGKAGIATATFSPGNAGELQLNAQQVTLRDGAIIGADTLGAGNAGNLTVNVAQLSVLGGSRIGAATGDRGNGATVRVNASDSIEISGASRDDPSVSSGLYTNTIATGNAGNLEIGTQRLLVRDGGAIAASTTGTGQAGKLNVTASDSIQVLGASSRLFFDSSGSGDAGQLNVSTQRLIVQDGGRVSAATSGTGRGGILDLNASESVEVSGAGGLFFDSRGAGNARGLRINTGSLVVTDGGQVTVSGTGTGISGNLEIAANSIFLNNQGRLRATTALSEGGNMNLQVAGSIILRNNSEITAEAFGSANGGNISIDAGGFILAILRENSDVVASAEAGRGGNIAAKADGIFGFRQFQGIRTPESDFTATSALGIDGAVAIDQEDRSLPRLPPEFLNVENLQQDACAARNGQIAGGSSFVVTGRGGLPENPGEDAAAIAPVVEWASPVTDGGTGSRGAMLAPRNEENSEQPREIRPARGWIMTPDGTIILTAEAPTTATDRLGFISPNCRSIADF